MSRRCGWLQDTVILGEGPSHKSYDLCPGYLWVSRGLGVWVIP